MIPRPLLVPMLAVALFLQPGPPAQAGKKKTAAFRKDEVSPGIGWHCWSNSTGSGCERDIALCRYYSQSSSDCGWQKKAAIFTALDVMNDDFEDFRFRSVKQCKKARAYLTKHESDDFTKVSKCQLVGELGTPLDRTLLPEGNGWFCIGGTGYCFRTNEECDSWIELTHGSGTCQTRTDGVWATSRDTDLLVAGTWLACQAQPADFSRCEEVR